MGMKLEILQDFPYVGFCKLLKTRLEVEADWLTHLCDHFSPPYLQSFGSDKLLSSDMGKSN